MNWVQTVCHSDGSPERMSLKNFILKKNKQTTIKNASFPSMQRVNRICVDTVLYLYFSIQVEEEELSR